MYSLHTPRNEEREEIFSTAGALCLGPAFTALSLVYPHFSIGDISFLGTRQGDCPTVDPSLGVQGASKHLYLRKSRSLSSLLSPLSPLPSTAASFQLQQRQVMKGVALGMKHVSYMYYLGIPRSCYPSLFLSCGTGRVCRTILYDVLLLLHMKTGAGG